MRVYFYFFPSTGKQFEVLQTNIFRITFLKELVWSKKVTHGGTQTHKHGAETKPNYKSKAGVYEEASA